MHFINTLTNSFALGEKDGEGRIIKEIGFPKGGLNYLIQNNNIKFYLANDYFYKNLIYSADAPLLIDGVLVPINSIPAALTKIFHQEVEGSVVDTDFNTESFNAIANSPVSIRFNEIEALQGTISGEVGTLSGEVQTKADRSEIPDVSNFIEMSAVTDYTYDKQTIDTKIENVEVDAYTKQESDARFQPIGDYLTKASGDTIYQPIGDYATRSEIPSVVGYADSVKYNSTTKYVEFYHGGTGGTKVFEYDAAPFLIDGMVQNVEIINGNLVISFNTDAGKQDITIPLTDIFDPSNYYDKTAIDGLLSAKANTATTYNKTEVDTALANKADTSAVTEAISSAVSGKVNTSTYNAYTAATDARLDDAKAYYINFMTIDSMRDEDWNGIVAAIDDHRPIHAGISFGGQIRYYGVEYMNKNSDNTEIVMTVSDNSQHYFYTITKNGSNDYSYTVETREYVSQAEKAAWNAKQNALSAGTGIEISGNVISATGGGGATYSAGTNISIANDTINCTLPISANTSNKNVTVGYDLNVREEGETSIGKYNVNRYRNALTHSENTIFTVGNGGNNVLRHNALEIRKNGDLYFADTSDNGQSYYEKPMVRLQDMYAALGGLKLVKLTQAEYDALATKDNSTLYVIVD